MIQRVPIVIHGLMGFLPFISRGTRNIDKLVDALPGKDSEDFLQMSREGAIMYLQSQIDRYGKIEVIIIGHSMGCYRALQVAEWCRKQGIRVVYIAAIDPTAINRWFGMKPMVVTENVTDVDEFWASFGVPAGARARAPDGSRGGMYVYPENWGGTHNIYKYKSGHIALASNDDVVEKIVHKVKWLL